MSSRKLMVLKVGGGEVDRADYLAALAGLVAGIDRRLVIVHGGGRDIARLLGSLGIESQFHEGLRVTGDEAIEVVEMVLSGLVNKRIAGALVAAGVSALGLSGRDLGVVKAAKLDAAVELGHVGQPESVDRARLEKILGLGWVPVVSPVSQDTQGTVYNINADHAARAVAAALDASELVFLSNVPGVSGGEGKIGKLDSREAESLIAGGVITGGMVPKVRSGLEALEAGVNRVLITDLDGLRRYLDGERVATLMTL
ncbi:MAG: acetylglutamate kinase [Gemmatimonadota bacterium]|nr:acetylglutamate kinase [Gemmatimonadota bacterium]